MNGFRQNHLDDYLDLAREFEIKKRSIRPDKIGPIYMVIPFSALESICKEHLNHGLKTAIESSTFASVLSLRKDKLRFEFDLFTSFYQSTIDSLITLIFDILSKSIAMR